MSYSICACLQYSSRNIFTSFLLRSYSLHGSINYYENYNTQYKQSINDKAPTDSVKSTNKSFKSLLWLSA